MKTPRYLFLRWWWKRKTIEFAKIVMSIDPMRGEQATVLHGQAMDQYNYAYSKYSFYTNWLNYFRK